MKSVIKLLMVRHVYYDVPQALAAAHPHGSPTSDEKRRFYRRVVRMVASELLELRRLHCPPSWYVEWLQSLAVECLARLVDENRDGPDMVV